MNENTRRLLIEHYLAYPKLQVQDLFKFLFQSAFGCEHMVSDEEKALGYIKSEYFALSETSVPKIDKLDGDYSRVYLSWLDDGLHPQTLSRLFCLSAKKEADGMVALDQKLEVAKKLVSDGVIPLRLGELEDELNQWKSAGFPAVHHSETFRTEYRPAYRVIANKYASLLPLLTKIDTLSEKDSTVIAIEGGSASGKTTLASILTDVYDCATIHADDFFLRPEQRTEHRLSEVGGNLDRERFSEEVVQSLMKKETVIYRPFDCSTQTLGAPVTVPKKKLTVVEGVYSTHPEFGKYYDLALFLDISSDEQRERITVRNSPGFAERFFYEWIPMENKYFEKTGIKDRCDLILHV